MPPHRILIVDDQREVSRLLRSTLETLEHDLEVVEIPSGEEAVFDSTRNKIDLLISDYRLAGMTGIELMHKVQKHHPQLKVILITGQTDPRIRKEVTEAGAEAFFIKPIPMAEFLETVEYQLGLIESVSPPKPEVSIEGESQCDMPELLESLCQELTAVTILLMSDNGRILARAGNLPDNIKELPLISSLLSIQYTGHKISHLIGQEIFSNWYAFNGGTYDLIFAPVGSTHTMLIIGKGIASEERVLRTMDIFSTARKNIQKIIGAKSLGKSAIQEPPTIPSKTVEQSFNEMESLLDNADERLKPTEANEFWEKAVDNHKVISKPDMLSYEQAKKLGLAPKEES
jgi:CheY-like chemotaxis protein